MSLKTLLESAGVDGLTPEFEAKLEAIVEAKAVEIADGKQAALTESHAAEIEALKESHAAEIADLSKLDESELVDTLDRFLDTTLMEWAKDNAVGIDSQIKLQLAESMLQGVANLMSEHSITVPEGSDTIVESLEAENAELREAANKALAESVDVKSELNAMKKAKILEEAADGLAETQKERLFTLAEDASFKDVESFTTKAQTFRSIVESGHTTLPKNDSDKKDKDKDGKADVSDKGEDKAKKQPELKTESEVVEPEQKQITESDDNVGAAAAAMFFS